MKTIKILALLFAIIIIAQSCRKENDIITITPPYTEPKIEIVGSVIGTVIDDNGIVVEDAMVSFEGNSVFTDEFGVFQFNDESLYSNGTYIKVTKDGYFNGSRNFYPSEGKTSIVAIELIPLNEVAEFSSSEGMKVNFENVELDFKANSIMNEDGSAYSGNVHVAAKYLDPTLINTLNQMPGDLTGTTTDQNRVVLTSMAMITVELLDDNGNKLQVQDGKTVDVQIPVPTTLQNEAPSTIPMWHFDEEVGTWIEEGSATLVNGMYETSLAHFSFWNCDIPIDFIFLKGSILNRGIPIQGVTVLVTVVNGGATGSAITDADGFFCGFVPKGVDLVLEIFDQCGNVIFTLNIPASEIDIFLDPINLNLIVNVATISGTVTYCEGIPSSETYVIASQGHLTNIISINDDHTFSGNIFYCSQDFEIAVLAVDPVNLIASETSTFNINGTIDGVELELCGDYGQLVDPRDGQNYLTTEINGITWTAENMRFDTDDAIPNGSDIHPIEAPVHHGRFYNHYSALEACPVGWHLPSKEEFIDLHNFLGGQQTSAKALKSIDGWVNNGGTNSSGFNALPVGIIGNTNNMLGNQGVETYFWTSSIDENAPTNFKFGIGLSSNATFTIIPSSAPATNRRSVRCIKD